MEFSRNIDTEKMSRRQRERVRRVQLVIDALQRQEERTTWPIIERPDAAQLPNTAGTDFAF